MKITHQFSVQLAKKLFIEESGLVVRMLENTRITEAIEANLKPLLIYSINIEGVSGRYVQFSSVENPLSIVRFLTMAWSKEKKEGMPQVLKVSKLMIEQFPWLIAFANQLGIEITITDGKDRSYTANQRSAQGIADSYHYSNSPRDNEHKISSLPVVADMNKPRYFQDGWIFPHPGTVSSMESYAIEAYQKLTKNYFNPNAVFHRSWDIFYSDIEWLHTGQKGVAPRAMQTIKNDIARSLGKISYEEFNEREEDEYTSILSGKDLVKKLLNCWPQSKSSVAKAIDVNLKEFEWYLTGKKGLDESSFYSLCDYIDMNESPDFEFEDGSALYELSGNYLLKATDKAKHVDDIFNELTGGGDCDYNVELVPYNGQPDPSFRFLLFGRYLNFNIIVFNRSSPAVSFMDDKTTRSNNGVASAAIPTKMYSDILRLFGEVSSGHCHPAEISGQMINWSHEIEKIHEQIPRQY